MVKLLVMQVPIADAKKNLCSLVDRVQKRGDTIIILRHGKPVAQIIPGPRPGVRRPVASDDPAKYRGINLDEPIMEPID